MLYHTDPTDTVAEQESTQAEHHPSGREYGVKADACLPWSWDRTVYFCEAAKQAEKPRRTAARLSRIREYYSTGTGTSDSDRVCMAPSSYGNALWSIGLGESDSSHATVAGQ
jgi:hypothetical protein